MNTVESKYDTDHSFQMVIEDKNGSEVKVIVMFKVSKPVQPLSPSALDPLSLYDIEALHYPDTGYGVFDSPIDYYGMDIHNDRRIEAMCWEMFFRGIK